MGETTVAIRTPRAEFKTERFQDTIVEFQSLIKSHWAEVAHFKDIPLDPDYHLYAQMENMGTLRFYTVRKSKTLIGYAIYFVRTNAHYKTSLQAVQDALFIHPDHRGFGRRFIVWCDERLREESVQVVYHHVKLTHDFGRMLEKLGYEKIESIYGRRLDK